MFVASWYLGRFLDANSRWKIVRLLRAVEGTQMCFGHSLLELLEIIGITASAKVVDMLLLLPVLALRSAVCTCPVAAALLLFSSPDRLPAGPRQSWTPAAQSPGCPSTCPYIVLGFSQQPLYASAPSAASAPGHSSPSATPLACVSPYLAHAVPLPAHAVYSFSRRRPSGRSHAPLLPDGRGIPAQALQAAALVAHIC
eukprot:scaffold7258_cov383-Prasinococcus_capsulatus_cf.AAC.3